MQYEFTPRWAAIPNPNSGVDKPLTEELLMSMTDLKSEMPWFAPDLPAEYFATGRDIEKMKIGDDKVHFGLPGTPQPNEAVAHTNFDSALKNFYDGGSKFGETPLLPLLKILVDKNVPKDQAIIMSPEAMRFRDVSFADCLQRDMGENFKNLKRHAEVKMWTPRPYQKAFCKDRDSYEARVGYIANMGPRPGNLARINLEGAESEYYIGPLCSVCGNPIQEFFKLLGQQILCERCTRRLGL